MVLSAVFYCCCYSLRRLNVHESFDDGFVCFDTFCGGYCNSLDNLHSFRIVFVNSSPPKIFSDWLHKMVIAILFCALQTNTQTDLINIL